MPRPSRATTRKRVWYIHKVRFLERFLDCAESACVGKLHNYLVSTPIHSVALRMSRTGQHCRSPSCHIIRQSDSVTRFPNMLTQHNQEIGPYIPDRLSRGSGLGTTLKDPRLPFQRVGGTRWAGHETMYLGMYIYTRTCALQHLTPLLYYYTVPSEETAS